MEQLTPHMSKTITPNLWFELSGNPFLAINADGTFKLSEAVSFAVDCEDQKEIDYYWGKLSAVPESEQCGWCKDKFGLSWQIVPKNMNELMARPGAFAKMMDMKKLVIADF
jgi:predicted 3-demethylubiquinone-9 3-methyltransferase (glyoxalase superfamily)